MAEIVEMPDVPDPVKGYPQLADFIGNMPEYGIFRRFGALNARNILYYQAELTDLENKLLRAEKSDYALSAKHPHLEDCASDWYWLGGEHRDFSKGRQLQIFLQIRAILPKYNEALKQQHAISSFSDPTRKDLQEIQYFIEEEMKTSFRGPDASVWGSLTFPKAYAKDLIVIRGRHNGDTFSRLMTDRLVWIYHRYIGRRFSESSRQSGKRIYKDSNLLRLAQILINIIACLLPIACILVLYFVESMSTRLGLIAAFNVVFVSCLSFFTNATSVEVFTATAAFCAVLVVFVSSNSFVIASNGRVA